MIERLSRGTRFALIAGPTVALAVAACSAGGTGGGGASSHTHTNTLLAASGSLPTMLFPADNLFTEARFQLGRHLFYDVRLSGNGTQSCGSCHLQEKAFTDGLPTSIGSTGEAHPRNAQPLANVGYNATLTWTNPALTLLERQMEVPLFGDNPVEMGLNDANKAAVLDRIKADTTYQGLFAAAYPGTSAGTTDAVTYPNIIKAIATFQRGLTSSSSKYDRYLRGQATLSAAETRGLTLFMGEKAECFHCHGSFNFNDQVNYAGIPVVDTPFHNTGLYNMGGTGAFPFPNRGLFEFTSKQADMGKFRAASLRNVAVTAPYMHDGTIATLREVLDFYAAGGRNITTGPNAGDGRANPNKSDLITSISLTGQDKDDIVAFLGTLTDEEFITNPRFADPFKAK